MRSTATAGFDIEHLRKSCSLCALRELCLPAGIEPEDFKHLDAVVKDRRVLERGSSLFRNRDRFHALYVVRSGSFKTTMVDEAGEAQVLGFHLPGEILGLDGLSEDIHVCNAEALERASVCELPYTHLQSVLDEIPPLSRQLMRIVSREVIKDHEHLVMMGKHQAQERLAIFLQSLSDRYSRIHRDGRMLTLPMSRYDIANYLGLVVETVSRSFTHMEELGILAVARKSVSILRPDLLTGLGTL